MNTNELTPEEAARKRRFLDELAALDRAAFPTMSKVWTVEKYLYNDKYMTKAQQGRVRKSLKHINQFTNIPEDPEVGRGYTLETWAEFHRYAHRELLKAAEAFIAQLPEYEQAYGALEEMASHWCTEDRVAELDLIIKPVVKKWFKP